MLHGAKATSAQVMFSFVSSSFVALATGDGGDNDDDDQEPEDAGEGAKSDASKENHTPIFRRMCSR